MGGAAHVIRGERIESVGPSASASVPAGATVMDLAGHTVIPGLVDLLKLESAAKGKVEVS